MDELFVCQVKLLDGLDCGGLQTFGAFFDGEFHLLAFLKIAEAFAFDGGVVDENVRAAFAGDEAVAFFTVEPFDRTDYTF